jgi:hypothetical protein
MEVVSNSSVTLNADHLIIYQYLYSRSIVHYTLTSLPIYLERGYPWKLMARYACDPQLIGVTPSQNFVSAVKYVDMCDNCVANALTDNFGERGCTADTREGGWW